MTGLSPGRQPWLHELVVCVLGNATALSDAGGDLRPGTVEGLYVDDRRALSRLELLIGDERPAGVGHGALGERAEFFGSARNLGSMTADPVVEVHRLRELVPGGMLERVRILSRALEPVTSNLVIRVGGDDADIAAVKSGHVGGAALRPEPSEVPGVMKVVGFTHTTAVHFDPPTPLTDLGDAMEATYQLDLQPGATLEVVVRVEVTRDRATALDADPGRDLLDWSAVRVIGQDPRLEPTLTAGLVDLRALALNDPLDRGDVFAGAGTPWYLTLFGRDSIWAARLTLPLGTTLARGTLRALARRQGQRHDAMSGEMPGRIPHEVRRFPYVDPGTGMILPSVYYGTVDATALWVVLLHEAWRWGLPDEDVRDLFGPLDAAVGWLVGDGIPDQDGLLKYLDVSGHGLANQGWKDSGDAIRFRDGALGTPPIALVEAQAYAVQALECAAALAEAFGRGGAEELRKQAGEMRDQVRGRYWANDPLGVAGRYLGLAVDGTGRLVDGLGSNMGHVLGTGVLNPDEATSVALQVTGPELLDRYGVRTLGSGNGGFNPIGYHTGSIWTHDTAI
ncbi:MAG TPA: glycogen debranching N-terminal domain-containing protein, partial [Lapillicoccus sp.]|nr:glycogen debranching N-terminal domain-containing protein [Lapillicoccus sp.]